MDDNIKSMMKQVDTLNIDHMDRRNFRDEREPSLFGNLWHGRNTFQMLTNLASSSQFYKEVVSNFWKPPMIPSQLCQLGFDKMSKLMVD